MQGACDCRQGVSKHARVWEAACMPVSGLEACAWMRQTGSMVKLQVFSIGQAFNSLLKWAGRYGGESPALPLLRVFTVRHDGYSHLQRASAK